jgi:DnaJ family protein C protein 2
LTFEQDDEQEADHVAKTMASTAVNSDDEDDVESEAESPALLNSDPKEWKKQDHYAVLGLSSLRYKATDSQIKKAHRKKVLKHHPDKKASAAHDSNDDSFFKCIAKAMETLSNPVKRRQFDSVDPGVDDDDVPRKPAKDDADFFAKWGPVFEREGRFSVKKPVPALGSMASTKPEVERFYDFWYNFDSWRSFEYEDDDSHEGSDR